MAKTTRFNLVRAQLGAGVRVRDVDFPRAPVRVTDDAQAKVIDVNTSRKFEFDHQQRGRLPERPSTSGGPATGSFTKRKNAEKRETKDDLYFNPLAAHGKGTTFYNFPLPGGPLQTLDQTPRSSSPLPRKPTLPPRSFTPESMEIDQRNMAPQPAMALPQTEIGMALGSPTHQPPSWQSQVASQAQFNTSTRSPSPDMIDDPIDASTAPTKPKGSRWKILGGLFGGKKNTTSQAQPFYQLQPEEIQKPTPPSLEAHVMSFGELTPTDARPKSRGRTRTNSERKTKKNKPDLKRANTAPLQFDFQSTGQTQPAPEITLDGGPLVGNGLKSNLQTPYSGQMLDVDIPSVQLERYSIMFGSVLQKTTPTSSSLLARRQATLDKLKTVNEALASKERDLQARERLVRPRRATSPQPTKSPAFSLFPNTPSRLTVREASPSPYRHSPLHRSNTSPAALSPSRPTFATRADNNTHSQFDTSRTQRVGPSMKSSAHHEQKQVPKQQPNPQPPRNWSPDESQLILDSPGEMSAGEEDIYDTSPLPMKRSEFGLSPLPMKPKLVEPSWQMINQVPQTTGSSTSGSDHSISASTSSTSASSVSASSTPHSASSTTQKHIPIQIPVSRSASHSGSTTPKHIPIQIPITIQSPLEPASLTRPTTSRSRSATTTALPQPRRNPSQASTASITSSSTSSAIPNPHDDEEHEARLKTAADVSIARQISVSRQQRQLLIPIKTSMKSTNSNGSLNKKYNQNFPSPLNSNLSAGVSVGRVASPLGAVAVAAQEERDREGRGVGKSKGERERITSPLVERREREKIEKLVDGPKPSTPTLVVVPGPVDEKAKAWGGATTTKTSGGPVGLAERRKGKGGGTVMGEIKVGLAVSGSGMHAMNGNAHLRDLEHRKSERVVVERVSIASN